MARQTETILLNEWLWAKHRTALQWKKVRLGPFPTKEMSRMYMVTMRWADSIFIEDSYVNIVEAKLTPDPRAIGQLLLYKELFPATPEFDSYKDWPIRLILLTTYLDLPVVELATKQAVEYEVYDISVLFEKKPEIRLMQ